MRTDALAARRFGSILGATVTLEIIGRCEIRASVRFTAFAGRTHTTLRAHGARPCWVTGREMTSSKIVNIQSEGLGDYSGWRDVPGSTPPLGLPRWLSKSSTRTRGFGCSRVRFGFAASAGQSDLGVHHRERLIMTNGSAGRRFEGLDGTGQPPRSTETISREASAITR